jgi:hypothetical protein
MTQGSNPSRKIQVIKTLAVRGTNNHVCVTSFLYQYCSEVILSRFLCEIFLTVFNCLRRSRETRIIKAYKLDPAKLGCFEK